MQNYSQWQKNFVLKVQHLQVHMLHKYFMGIKELLRKVNSYYSNQIESEGTHPIDIDKATRQEFSSDSKEKQLQQLSLVHIEVQKYVESYFN